MQDLLDCNFKMAFLKALKGVRKRQAASSQLRQITLFEITDNATKKF